MERKEREYYHVCDTGRGGRRLRQLSLTASLTRRTMGEADDTRDLFSGYTTVGQGERGAQTRAGIKMSKDQ